MGQDRRPELHQVLKGVFNSNPHVYFQPPENVKLVYPCIIYKLDGMPDRFADNLEYFEHRNYQLTVIDTDPDSELREKVAKLKWCRFNRHFVADNLNHYIFTIYY